MVSKLTTTQKHNVGATERIASAAVGGLLLTWGIRKRSPTALAGALVGADLVYRGVSGHCHLYNAMGVNTSETRKDGSEIRSDAPSVHRAITIGKSPEELCALWRDPNRLAQIMAHFADVTPQGEGITNWKVHGPFKQAFEWNSRTTEDEPGRKLSWRSLPGTELPNRGFIRFDPGPENVGTVVTLQMQFEPPFGSAGAAVIRTLNKVPRAITGKSLRRFKSLAETGEIPTLEKNPSGRGTSDSF